MLATVPTCKSSSGLGLEPGPIGCNSFATWKTRTIAFGPGSTSIPGLCEPRFFVPIKYLSSDRIVAWSICRLCSFCRSFTSHSEICDAMNMRWVAIKNLQHSHRIGPIFTATQRISVGSQIWNREVKERLELHNLRIDHVTIQSKLKYLIGAKAVGTEKLEPRSGSNLAQNPRFYVWSRSQTATTKWGGFLAGSGTKPNQTAGQNLDRWRVTRTRC